MIFFFLFLNLMTFVKLITCKQLHAAYCVDYILINAGICEKVYFIHNFFMHFCQSIMWQFTNNQILCWKTLTAYLLQYSVHKRWHLHWHYKPWQYMYKQAKARGKLKVNNRQQYKDAIAIRDDDVTASADDVSRTQCVEAFLDSLHCMCWGANVALKRLAAVRVCRVHDGSCVEHSQRPSSNDGLLVWPILKS